MAFYVFRYTFNFVLKNSSSYDGSVKDFELGDEVEFSITQKGGKFSAENLRRINRGHLLHEVNFG